MSSFHGRVIRELGWRFQEGREQLGWRSHERGEEMNSDLLACWA